MPGHDIIVVGASAGGIEALSALVAGLPEDLPASLFVIIHFPDYGTSVLPRILNRNGKLPSKHAIDGERIRPGNIYVGLPGRHMLLKGGNIEISRGPREHGHRPAIDPLFRSAARTYGRRVIGVILSGLLDDGALGLHVIQLHGGVTVVQDPADAQFPSMPLKALEAVATSFVSPIAEMAELLVRLVNTEVEAGGTSVAEEVESDPAFHGSPHLTEQGNKGAPTHFTCPECGGALWEMNEAGLLHYRCHVGHAYSDDSLLSEQSDRLESALWTALRTLEERAALTRRLQLRAEAGGHVHTARGFARQTEETQASAAVLRNLLVEDVNGKMASRAEEPPPEGV